ncbi:sulfite exporter TauE/SafE family protein, partial [Clavibacter nebraskensis]
TLLAPRIPAPGARAAVLVISFAGAVTAIVKGVGGLV